MLFRSQLSNFGRTIPMATKHGTRFAICDMATHFFATQLAAQTKGDADAIYKELAANLIPSGRLVPAGVVAVRPVPTIAIGMARFSNVSP